MSDSVAKQYSCALASTRIDDDSIDVHIVFATPTAASTLDLVALEDALTKLGEISNRLVRIIELRFFGGLQFKEVAFLLDISLPTAERDWRKARAWLNRELTGAR